jgi:hypothetical protein
VRQERSGAALRKDFDFGELRYSRSARRKFDLAGKGGGRPAALAARPRRELQRCHSPAGRIGGRMRPIAWLRLMLAALARAAVLGSAPAFAVCYTSANGNYR